MESIVLSNGDQLLALRHEWDDLHAKTGGAVYQSFSWISTWWDVYKEKIRMELLTVRSNGRLVGVVPCYVEVRKFGVCALRRLRMMGEYETSGEYEPLCLDQNLDDVAVAATDFFAHLLRRHEIDVIDFHHFSTSSDIGGRIVRRAKSQGLFVRHQARSAIHLVLANPPDWESYLQLLTNRDRRTRVKREKALANEGAEVEIIPCVGNESAFNDFVELHTKAMAMRSLGGHFLAKEGYGRFLRQMTVGASDPEMARWFFYKRDSERFAGLLAFYSRDACCLYLSGRNPYHDLARLSPGIVLMNVVIRDAIARGYKTVDFVEGGTPYKFTLGAKDEGFGRTLIAKRIPTNFNVLLYIAAIVFRQSKPWLKHLEPLRHRWHVKRRGVSPSASDSSGILSQNRVFNVPAQEKSLPPPQLENSYEEVLLKASQGFFLGGIPPDCRR